MKEQDFEIPQLMPEWWLPKPPDEWRLWPTPYREAAEAAVEKKLAELRESGVVPLMLYDRSFCMIRADLSGHPYQLSRLIRVRLVE